LAKTAADVFVDALIQWGVRVMFGVPGEGTHALSQALQARRERIRFLNLRPRQPESGAYMACAYAKYGGGLGACLDCCEPGRPQILQGIRPQDCANNPVIAVTGHSQLDISASSCRYNTERRRVLDRVTIYQEWILNAADAEEIAHRACRLALTRGGIAHIDFPVQVQEAVIGGEKPAPLDLDLPEISPRRSPAFPEQTSISLPPRIAVV
jgi:pyruvate dehydrogenase (quinone)